MKAKRQFHARNRFIQFTGFYALVLFSATQAHAQESSSPIKKIFESMPVQMNFPTFIIIGFLLVLSIIFFFLYQRRCWKAEKEVNILRNELNNTRTRLTQTHQELEETTDELRFTNKRYQGILYDSNVGMFQADINGKCTYINAQLEKLSGLYPKKALKQGLTCGMHPEDVAPFEKAWEEFTQKNKPLCIPIRFVHAKGRETQVMCTANPVYDEKKDVESYIGWMADVTVFYDQCTELKRHVDQHQLFIDETIEGFYKLSPEKPISLNLPHAKLVNKILEEMKLESCSDTFAALYGASIRSFQGKQIGAIPGGCGLFRGADDVEMFIHNSYRSLGVETIRQDPRGNRLNLSNNVVGLIHDNHLIGIWGSQRNISREKREITETKNQTEFMNRILNAMPTEISVKDSRCRYLYVSAKQAQRTTIPQEEWIGKTIFEVLPGTPRDADAASIHVMKTQKPKTTTTPFENSGKTGWLENIHQPIISDEGVIEGVINVAFDVTERKAKEEKLERFSDMTAKRLEARDKELREEKQEHNQTAIKLQELNRKARVHEAELETRSKEFELLLSERKRAEDILIKSRDDLQNRQKELEAQLAHRLDEVCESTEKQKRAEAALQTSEEELKRIDELAKKRTQQLEIELKRREDAEAELIENRNELEEIRQKLERITLRRENELAELQDRQKRELSVITGQKDQALTIETAARKEAEKQLRKTEDNLAKTQEHCKEVIQQHTEKIEAENEKRIAVEKQLKELQDELNMLRRNFNIRIEAETKELKQQLANKQIRERALRDKEKQLTHQITELQKQLETQNKEHQQQLKTQEELKQEIQALKRDMEKAQQKAEELLATETESIREESLQAHQAMERLQTRIAELEQVKREQENRLKQRTEEIGDAAKQREQLNQKLTTAKAELKEVLSQQAEVIAQQTQVLQKEIDNHIETERQLRAEREALQTKTDELQTAIRQKEQELQSIQKDCDSVKSELKQLRITYDLNRKNTVDLIKESKKALEDKLKKHEHTEHELGQAAMDLKNYALELRKEIAQRNEELAEETATREELERQLEETQGELELAQSESKAEANQIRKELESRIEEHRKTELELQNSEADLKRTIAELNTKIKQQNSELEHETDQRKGVESELASLKTNSDERAERYREERQALTHELEQKIAAAHQKEMELHSAKKELESSIVELETELKQVNSTWQGDKHNMEKLKQTIERQKRSIHEQEKALNLAQEKAKVEVSTVKSKAANDLEEQIEKHRNQEAELQKAGQDLLMQVHSLDLQLSSRVEELNEEKAERKKIEHELKEVRTELKSSRRDMDASIKKSIRKLEATIAGHQKNEAALQRAETELKKQIQSLETKLRERTSDLEQESAHRIELEKKHTRLDKELENNRTQTQQYINKATADLKERIERLEKTERELRRHEEELNIHIKHQQDDLNRRALSIAEAEEARRKAEQTLREKIEQSGLSESQTEQKIAKIKALHEENIRSQTEEVKKLREAETYYREIFTSAPEAIFIINPNSQTIVKANSAAAELFSVDAADSLVDRSIDQLSSQRQPNKELSIAAIKPHLKNALEHGFSSFEWSYKRTEEELFCGLTSFNPIRCDGNTHIVTIIHDISSIKQEQAELLVTLDKAQKANRTHSKIVDEITGTIKTELDPVIKTTTDPQFINKLVEPQQLVLQDVNETNAYIINMLDYKCALLHTADGTGLSESEMGDMHQLLRQLDLDFSQKAEAKKLFFALSFAQKDSEHSIPSQVKTDMGKVHEVLDALLNHAILSTSKGRLGIHAMCTESINDKARIAFEIAFTSDAKESKSLTELFGSEEFDENLCTKETDFSLALARHYARLLGGDIDLEYRAHGVTCLTFNFLCRNLDSCCDVNKSNENIGAA